MWNCETAPYFSQSQTKADFTPPFGFLGLDISTSTAESGWGLGFVYIFLCLPLKVAFFFLLLHLIYKERHLFPI
jgi:hypothetical protein